MRRFLIALAPVVAAIALFAVARGSIDGRPSATAGELDQLIGTEWYSVRIFGQPNGYACIETERVVRDGEPALRVTETMKVMVTLSGRDLEAGKSQVTIYDADLRPVSIELLKNELGRQSQVEARLQDGQMVVRAGSPEPEAPEPTVRRLDAPPDLASDLLVHLKLLRDELAVGDSLSYHVYDPEIDMIDRHDATVLRREELAGTETLVVKATSEKLGIEVVSWIDDRGRMLRQSVPGMMELTLERVSEEEALASLAPFEIKNQIEVEQHLPLIRSLREVRLRVKRNVGTATELIPASHRQTVTADGEDALIAISRETPPDETLSIPITDPALEDYLAATKHVQSDDPRIVEKATEIVGEETDAWGAAQKLCSWVHREMRSVPSEPRPITALECLQEMRGDCTEHAILLAALGRAVGLPTKLCTGLAYIGGSFGYHAWTEVYVGRWVEMDPSWGEMTADAGHLLVYSSSLDEASYARASLATGRTIGAITIEVRGYTRADGQQVEVGEEQ